MRRSQLWMLSLRLLFVGSKWLGTIQERCFSTASGCQSGKKAGASQPAVYISSMRVTLACPMVMAIIVPLPVRPPHLSKGFCERSRFVQQREDLITRFGRQTQHDAVDTRIAVALKQL